MDLLLFAYWRNRYRKSTHLRRKKKRVEIQTRTAAYSEGWIYIQQPQQPASLNCNEAEEDTHIPRPPLSLYLEDIAIDTTEKLNKEAYSLWSSLY